MLLYLFCIFLSYFCMINSQTIQRTISTKRFVIMIVGESGSGKTSLIKLFDDVKTITLPSANPNSEYFNI